MSSGSEAGSYLRRIDSCITQLKAQGPSRTCNESKEEEEEDTTDLCAPAMTTRHACALPRVQEQGSGACSIELLRSGKRASALC